MRPAGRQYGYGMDVPTIVMPGGKGGVGLPFRPAVAITAADLTSVPGAVETHIEERDDAA